ncbi:MAG: LysM peptidoglycan-binding domain-containing protein [Mycobacteriales bacterium]
MTRRGRIVILLLSVTVGFGLLSLGEVASQAATRVQRAPRLRHAVVQPGETLWQIATRADPAADPRIVVGELMALNHLSSAQLLPGETLLLPVP